MSDVTLTSAVRSNLLALQNTAQLLGRSQERLATGLRVNSALDDPTAFFTASSLNSRASDLSRLLDSVGLAVQTLKSADNAISSITKLVESAQATARQALQSPAAAATAASVAGSDAEIDADVAQVFVGGGTFDTSAAGGSFTINGETINFAQDATRDQVRDAINNAMEAAEIDIVASHDGTRITLTAGDAGTAITLGGANLAAVGLDSAHADSVARVTLLTQDAVEQGDTLTIQVSGSSQLTITFGTGAGEVSTLAQLNAALDTLAGGSASIDNDGNISITAGNNSSTITVGGDAAGAFGLTAGVTQPTPGVNANRASLETEFNNLRTQIDQLAADAGFNGINLLMGDNLSVIFNEDGSSSLAISGVSFDSGGLGIGQVATGGFQTNGGIETVLGELDSAIASLRSQAATFGSNMSVVETRQSFTKNMINVLETGAGNLTLADTNEEGANLLALQTRQQLSSVALSLAAQADQNVLRLF